MGDPPHLVGGRTSPAGAPRCGGLGGRTSGGPDVAASRRDRGAARAWTVGLAGVAAVAVLAVVAIVVLTQDEEGTAATGRGGAQVAVDRFVEALNRGVPGEGGTVQPAEDVAASFTAATEGLGDLTLTATASEVTVGQDEATATAPLAVEWSVDGATWQTD